MTSLHTRLSPAVYLDHVRTESLRFREVLAGCDPEARVPSCPDWNAADLLWHLATVQRWWAEVLTARPERPEEVVPQRPDAYDGLLAAFDEWSAALATALEGADPAEEAWNWSDDHTVGFILPTVEATVRLTPPPRRPDATGENLIVIPRTIGAFDSPPDQEPPIDAL